MGIEGVVVCLKTDKQLFGSGMATKMGRTEMCSQKEKGTEKNEGCKKMKGYCSRDDAQARSRKNTICFAWLIESRWPNAEWRPEKIFDNNKIGGCSKAS